MNRLTAVVRTKKFLLVTLVSAGILALLTVQSVQLGQPADDANYIILAESLTTGHGYRLISFPEAPREQWFPIGWPLLLTPFVILRGENYELTRAAPYFFTLASILVLYMLSGIYWKNPVRYGVLALYALAPVS